MEISNVAFGVPLVVVKGFLWDDTLDAVSLARVRRRTAIPVPNPTARSPCQAPVAAAEYRRGTRVQCVSRIHFGPSKCLRRVSKSFLSGRDCLAYILAPAPSFDKHVVAAHSSSMFEGLYPPPSVPPSSPDIQVSPGTHGPSAVPSGSEDPSAVTVPILAGDFSDLSHSQSSSPREVSYTEELERKEFTLGESIMQSLRIGQGLSFLVVLDAILTSGLKAAHIRFQPSLVGMAVVCSGLLLSERLVPATTAKVLRFFSPCLVFLTRYMPMFFVPPLIVLPLVRRPSSLDMAKLGFVTVIGFAFTLFLTAYLVLRFRKMSQTPVQAPRAPARLPAPPPNKKLLMFWAVFYAISVVVPLSFGLGVDAVGKTDMPLVLPNDDPRFLTSLISSFGAHPSFLTGPSYLALTVSTYLLGTRGMTQFLHPLVFCALATSLGIAAMGFATGAGWKAALGCYLANSVPGLTTFGAGDLLMRMLGPSIISLGFRLFKQRAILARHKVEILGGVMCSATLSLFFTAIVARLVQLPAALALVTLPRSVTTPIAIGVAGLLGSNESLTACIVIISGVLGASFGRRLLSLGGFSDPIARGVAIGCASHGVGTGELVSKEQAAAPMSAVALTLMGITTALLVSVPPFRRLLISIATGQ